MTRSRSISVLFLVALLAGACASASAPYSAATARDLSRLKSRTVRLMEQAEEPFRDNAGAVAKLAADLHQAARRDSLRPRNQRSVAQWTLMLQKDGHLWGGFVARWEREERVGPTFIVEASKLVESAFDEMIAFERSKLGGPDG